MVDFKIVPLAAGMFVMMKNNKMMLVKDGNGITPMDYEIVMTDGSTVMLDGTMKSKCGRTARMTEGQMMTLDGKLISL